MDYLTLDMVKQHLRIDYNDDDERLIKMRIWQNH